MNPFDRIPFRPPRALLLLVLFCVVAAAAQAAPSVTLRQVATGLSSPVEIVNAHDGSNRLFVLEQGGRIRIIAGGVLSATPFLDLTGSGLILSGGERGLLGLAFHPQYAQNGAFYVYYTRTGDGALTIARYLRDPANANAALPASGAVILTIPHPVNDNHNGGHIAFGPDGFLYAGIGDGGSGGDPLRNGQNRAQLLGKLLRIAVDGGTGYTIPASNPYAQSSCAAGTCPEIWAYGLRNPWKFSFDRSTGDLIIGDVGQGAWEEVDFQAAGAAGGTNYGWGIFEGNACFNDNYFGSPGACAGLANHTHPVITYDHGSLGGIAITGGYRYRGANSPALRGYYVYGDYGSRRVWAASRDAGGAWTTVEAAPASVNAAVGAISSFGEDEAGELYLADINNGKVFAVDGPPLALAVVSRKVHGATGTFDLPIDATQAIGGAVTVEPRAIGTGHLVVFQFGAPVTAAGTPSVVNAAGAPIGSASASVSGNEVQVTLTGLPDNQRVTVSLSNVNNAGLNVSAALGFLLGDVSGSRAVNSSDISGVKARSGHAVDATNFRFDVNVTGAVNPAAVSAVKARSGLVLP